MNYWINNNFVAVLSYGAIAPTAPLGYATVGEGARAQFPATLIEVERLDIPVQC